MRTYAHDVHPLLFPLLLHWWLQAWGASELAGRLLAALAGIASLPLVFLLGRRAGGPAVGLAAALLTATNPFHLYYSQEVRSYSLLVLFAAWSCAALIPLLDRPGWRAIALYVLPAALAVHTHYYGLVLVGSELLAGAVVLLASGRGWPALRPLLAAGAALVLLYLPWAGPLGQAAGRTLYWPARPRPWFFAGTFHRYFGEQWPVTLAAALLLLALPVLLRGRAGAAARADVEVSPSAARRNAALLALTILLALLVPYVWSLLRVPILLDRCTIIVLPALLTLIAMGAMALPARWARALAVLLLAGGSLAGLVRTRYFTTPTKEQWRQAARWATAPGNRHPGDAFVSQLAPGFAFYFAQDRAGASVEGTRPAVLRRVLRDPGAAGVWLLVARDRAGEPPFRRLLEQRFVKLAAREFLATRAEYWLPRRRLASRPVPAAER